MASVLSGCMMRPLTQICKATAPKPVNLVKENVERARQLYLQFIESVAQTMAVWGTPPVGHDHTWIQQSACAGCQIRKREC